MELMVPVKDMDNFDFNSARNSPYPSAPTTPRRFGECYFSAPPSPSRDNDFYSEFDDYIVTSSNTIVKISQGDPTEPPIEWDFHPGTPKSSTKTFQEDFAFDVGEEVEEGSVSAEELFDGGMIRPLEPPRRVQDLARKGHGESSARKSRASASRGNRAIMGAFLPREKNEHDPSTGRERGRERSKHLSSSSRRATRSLSPVRVSDQYPCEEDEQELLQNQKQPSTTGAKTSTSSSSSKSQKKWSFKDFFLFRNASEGRASDKDLLRKYTATFRVVDNPPSVAGSNPRRGRPPVSPHELLYTENRAARAELKKKTFLPYKGVWGRATFNPKLANALGFSH